MLDSCEQRSEQQAITWRIQCNTNAKSVFAAGTRRWHFVVVVEAAAFIW